MKLLRVSLLLCPISLLAVQPDRLTAPIDPGRTVVLRGHVPSRVRAQNDRGLVDPALELHYMTLLVKPSPEQQGALDRLLERQQEPGTPEYHRWLQPEEFADRFGLTRSDVAKIRGWLEGSGFQVHDVARGRHWITFSGSAGQVSRALHTEIHRYLVNGEMHYANATAPSIPAALSGIVAGIRGLDDLPTRRPPPARPMPKQNIGGAHYLSPDDYATIYDLKPLYAAGIDGTGQKIAIAGESDINLNDTRTFRLKFNLPANDPQIVAFGPDPGTSTSSATEANLDIQWAGAVAPQAQIIYVLSRSAFTSAQYAIDQNLAPVLSISYGFCEAGDQQGAPAMRTVAQQGNAQGITWMAAAGDNGAADCDEFGERQATLGYAIDFPGDLPEVTSVGGTQFNEGTGTYWDIGNNANGGSALGYIPEAVWNTGSGITGGGGGASILFSKPPWQSGPGVPDDGARDVPDVSLTASGHDAYQIQVGGSSMIVGGTSASAPSFAGMVALLNQYLVTNGAAAPGVGNINPMLYRMAQSVPAAFHDIVDGNNTVVCMQISPGCVNGLLGWSATPGYDLATGVGTVDAYNFITQYSTGSGAGTVTTIAASASSIQRFGSVTFTATVTSSAGLPTGTVSFHAGDLALGTADLDGTGNANFTLYGGQLATGDSTITGTYLGDSSFSGSSASVPLHIDLPTSASAIVPSITPNPIAQSGSTWPYTIRLSETAGTATTLTDFTINGVSHASEIAQDFGSAAIPAKGSVSARLSLANPAVPGSVTFGFAGKDASGQTWSQQLTVPVYGAPFGSSLSFSISPGTIRQNPNADPSCQWSHLFSISETSGFPLQVTKVLAGSNDISAQIPQIFGSSRIAPFGAGRGTICWSGITAPSVGSLEVDATILEIGGSYKLTGSPSFQVPLASPGALQVSPAQVTLTPDDSGNASATISVNLGGAALAWTAARFPNNRSTTWLTLSPASGTGDGAFIVQASAAGLSPGVYKGTIAVTATSAFPTVIDLPVALVVGGSPAVSISGIANVASGQQQAAPGMTMSISGTGLAPGTQSTTRSPLPLSMQGVSVTVNGVSAPLISVSDGQLIIQVPYEVGAGIAALGVNNNGQVASYLFPVVPAAPGIFADANGNLLPQASAKAGQNVNLLMTGDGDINTTLTSGTTPAASTATSRLPHPTQPVTVTVGGMQVTPSFVGVISGLIGQTEVTFAVPDGLTPGPQSVVVTVGNVSSPPVNLNVTQ